MDGEKTDLRLLLIGKTGSGKSSLGNTLLGDKRFTVSNSFEAVTKTCKTSRNVRFGFNIQITDTPGVVDFDRSNVFSELVKSVCVASPGPHAILLVLRYGHFSDEDYKVHQVIKSIFGTDMAACGTIVVFTHGDFLRAESSSETEHPTTPPELADILNECNNRYVIFDNTLTYQESSPESERLCKMAFALQKEADQSLIHVKQNEKLEMEIKARQQLAHTKEMDRENAFLDKQAQGLADRLKKYEREQAALDIYQAWTEFYV